VTESEALTCFKGVYGMLLLLVAQHAFNRHNVFYDRTCNVVLSAIFLTSITYVLSCPHFDLFDCNSTSA